MTECAICCSSYTKRDRAPVHCLFCNHAACAACYKTYIIGNPNIPHCMECKHEWSNDFLVQNFTKKFIKTELKVHRKLHLFETEKTKFDEAQVIIEREEEARELTHIGDELYMQWRIGAKKAEDARSRIWGSVSNTERNSFKIHCPGENCNAFLNSSWNCGVCKKRYCAQCFEERVGGEEHECKQEMLDTANLIRKDSKPCPSCGIFIHKIHGCDQMFCTECNTAFGWKSGRIINGQIHNPHFFEAQRRLGTTGTVPRNPLDIPCGGIPTAEEVMRVSLKDQPGLIEAYLAAPYPSSWHKNWPMNSVLLANDIVGLTEDLGDLSLSQHEILRLRVLFVKGELTEESYKARLYKSHISGMHYRSTHDVMTMAHTVIGDSIRQYAQLDITQDDLANVVMEILNYLNSTLTKIASKYNRTAVRLYFDFATHRYTHHGRGWGDGRWYTRLSTINKNEGRWQGALHEGLFTPEHLRKADYPPPLPGGEEVRHVRPEQVGGL